MTTPPTPPPLTCLECGQELFYAGRGRRPKYCSSGCRHRGWERRRAADEGLVAREVVDRVVAVEADLSAETVTAWLENNPQALTKVARTLDLTGPAGKAVGRGFAANGSGFQLVESDFATQANRYQRAYRMQKFDAESLKNEVDFLRRQLDQATRHHRPMPMASADDPGTPEQQPATKTITMAGKTFTVPATWSRQQARQWARKHPEKGTPN